MGGNAGFTLFTARDRARGRDGRVKGVGSAVGGWWAGGGTEKDSLFQSFLCCGREDSAGLVLEPYMN